MLLRSFTKGATRARNGWPLFLSKPRGAGFAGPVRGGALDAERMALQGGRPLEARRDLQAEDVAAAVVAARHATLGRALPEFVSMYVLRRYR